MKFKTQFRASSLNDKIQQKDRRMLTPFQTTIDYPEIPSVDLVWFDDHFWCFRSETSKLASNTASFCMCG